MELRTHPLGTFLARACATLRVDPWQHMYAHTCTHTAASLIPIKWGLVCVRCDGLPWRPHLPPSSHTHTPTSVERMCEANVLAAEKAPKNSSAPPKKNTLRCQSRYTGAINGTKSYQISTPVYLRTSHIRGRNEQRLACG